MINNSEILLTGGTGSLGKTLLKILTTEYKPHGIRIFSRDELKQWELQQKIKQWNISTPIAFLIGDVRDLVRLEMACHKVDIVINCAAMKQVPACEYNPFEAIKTNVDGAKNLINACLDQEVKQCIHISTDKAVYPINLYGKTKAVAESLFIHGNVYSGLNETAFNVCRYGNVLGSRGSIIPLFRKQMKEGLITITDFNMTRFWITLDKVAHFILDSINTQESSIKPRRGHILVPKMPSMKVIDIAKTICDMENNMSSFKEIGIRKGEKVHECLITFEESKRMIEFEDYYELCPLNENEIIKYPWAYYSDTNERWLKPKELKEMINASNL